MKTKLPKRRRIGLARRIQALPLVVKNRRAAPPVLKLKRIMVPIDFSSCSRKALQYAVLLARDYHACIVLLHVVDAPSANSPLLERRKIDLETLAREEVRERVPIIVLVKAGDPLREIIQAAAGSFIDLLLISTHARAWLPDLCLGSAAEQIVRYAPCPVLVVREEEHDFLNHAKALGKAKLRWANRGDTR